MSSRGSRRQGFWVRAFLASRARFKRVWGSDYPTYWYYIDAGIGFVTAVIFVVLYQPDSDIALRVGWFFCAWLISFVVAFAASYGVVRARNWNRKDKY